ncbi:MAG: hypothetical protein P1P76_10915 [Anaerolineales bacterium]|nr:hypothetical protein [Anaerolineales bacterium]
MTKRSRVLLIVTSSLLLAALACGGSISTANIGDAWMSFDLNGEQKTDVFSQDDIFYAQVDLRNAPDDTSLKAVWTAVNVADTEPDFLINETEFTTGSGPIHFDLSNTSLWPTGSYKVDIFLNDELSQTLEFAVQ